VLIVQCPEAADSLDRFQQGKSKLGFFQIIFFENFLEVIAPPYGMTILFYVPKISSTFFDKTRARNDFSK